MPEHKVLFMYVILIDDLGQDFCEGAHCLFISYSYRTGHPELLSLNLDNLFFRHPFGLIIWALDHACYVKKIAVSIFFCHSYKLI